MSHVLHCGDGIAGMAAMPDRSVDHVITDPPYSKAVVTSAKSPLHSSPEKRDRISGNALCEKRNLGYVGMTDEVRAAASAQIARICRRWAIVFCDAESLTAWRVALENHGLRHIRMGAWVSPFVTPQFTGDRPGTGWEAAEIAHAPGRLRWNGGGGPAVWTVCRPTNGSGERTSSGHPTPKPLALMERLVADFTDPGDLICDPFAGSGTLLIAAKRLGRNALGWELNEAWHAAAVRRIDAAREQFQLPRLERKPKQLPLSGPDGSGEAA